MSVLSWDTVSVWLQTHGIRILIIAVVAAVLWFALRKFLPPVVRRTVSRTGYK